jgi:hypothetical protein
MLKRLVAWLADRTGVAPTIDSERLKGGTDAVERGMRWEAFYREEGGLRDMLDALRREAFEAAAELDPKDTDKIYYWATADRNIRRLQARIENVVATGRIENERRRAVDAQSRLKAVKAMEF